MLPFQVSRFSRAGLAGLAQAGADLDGSPKRGARHHSILGANSVAEGKARLDHPGDCDQGAGIVPNDDEQDGGVTGLRLESGAQADGPANLSGCATSRTAGGALTGLSPGFLVRDAQALHENADGYASEEAEPDEREEPGPHAPCPRRRGRAGGAQGALGRMIPVGLRRRGGTGRCH